MAERYIAAYDFGTSGCKLALVDMQGDVKYVASESYPLLSPSFEWAEQDPEEYWKAACRVTRRLLGENAIDRAAVVALAFATIWKGIIPLDKQGNVLYNNILWLDGRSHAEAARVNALMGTDFLSNKDYWPKLVWYRTQRPQLYEKTEVILEVNSYLKYKATGERSVDIANHYTRSFDPKAQSFYNSFLQATDIDSALFPPITDSTDMAGRVTQRAAEELGLAEGTPVYGGCTDVTAIPVGTGACADGMSHIYLGTSGWFGQITPVAAREHCCKAAPFRRKLDVTIMGMSAACASVDWAVDRFYPGKREELEGGLYMWLEKELKKVSAGSDGLICTNWLYGEKPPVPANAYGMYLNISYRHHAEHFVNAMREAACYMLQWKRNLMVEAFSRKVTSVRAAGGGALSPHWMQMMANIMNLPVEVPANAQHAGTVGAAYCALIGMGECEGFDEAAQRIKAEKRYEPDSACRSVYEDMFEIYMQLGASLKGVFDRLDAIKD